MRDKSKLFLVELKKPRSKHVKELYDKIVSGVACKEDIDSAKCKPWIKKILYSELESAGKMVENLEASSRAEEIASIMRKNTQCDSTTVYSVYRYNGRNLELTGKKGRLVVELKTGNYVLAVGNNAVRINQLYFEPDKFFELLSLCEKVGEMEVMEYNKLVQQAISESESENSGEVGYQDAVNRVDQRIADAFSFRRI